MNYNSLERALRSAVRMTLGAKSTDFDAWLVTCDPNEDMALEALGLGAGAELTFDPSISPFSFFSGDVVFFAFANNGTGELHVLFGNGCSDPELANEASKGYGSYGWQIEDEFDECSALHLSSSFSYDENSEHALVTALSECIEDLLDDRHVNTLRPFIHYFDN